MNGRAERAEAVSKSGLSSAFLAELKALVDAKRSSHPASVQVKARAEIWTLFNRHFGIAEYVQLPAVKMPEARDFIIELQVRALKVLPPAPQKELPPARGNDKYEAYLEAVEEFRAQIMEGISRLLQAGLRLVDVYKFGPDGISGFSHIFLTWLNEIPSPQSPCSLTTGAWSGP